MDSWWRYCGVLFSGLSLLNTKPVYRGGSRLCSIGNSKSAAATFLSQNPALSAIAGLGGDGGRFNRRRCKPSTTSVSALSSMPKPPTPQVAGMRFKAGSNRRSQLKKKRHISAQSGIPRYRQETGIADHRDDLPGLPGLFNRGRARELSNAVALNEQINKIKPQALASSQAAVDYG